MSTICAGEDALVLPADVEDDPAGYARFNRSSGRWSALAPPRYALGDQLISVWTGSEVVVWGNGQVAAYRPSSNRWRRPARPSERAPTSVIWAGDRSVLYFSLDPSTDASGYETYVP